MSEILIRDPKNIDDPEVIRDCFIAHEMRRNLFRFMMYVVEQLQRHPVTAAVRVVWAILDRSIECAMSIELLCIKNHGRDAAILLLNLYELRTDLKYIALDSSRADVWIDHQNEGRKPWTVSSQLKAIFKDERERDAEFANFRRYSTAKHGNPVTGTFSFPLAPTRNTLSLEVGGPDAFIRAHLLFLAGLISSVAESASTIWKGQGLNVGDFSTQLRSEYEALARRHEQHLLRLLRTATEENRT